MSITENALLTDRDVVVDLLRRTGPRSMTDLRADREIDRWSASRVEDAVVQAWADNRLSVDVEDRLVAL